jgi:hypothetical protein
MTAMTNGHRKKAKKQAWKKQELGPNDVIVRPDEARDSDIVIPYVSIRHVLYQPALHFSSRVMGPGGVGKSTVCGSCIAYKFFVDSIFV